MQRDQSNDDFHNHLDQMTQEQMLAYHAYLMQLESKQQSEGKVQGSKYEKEQEMKPQQQKISQSFLVNQREESDKNLCSTRAETSNYQESMYSYNQSNQSNYLEYRDFSRAPSTMNHTANTSNFEYITASRVDPNQTWATILDKQWDQSIIQPRSQPQIDRQQIRRLQIQFQIPLRQLGYQRSLQNLLRSRRSRQHLRSMPKLFRQDKKTYLFIMDFGEDSDIIIDEMLLKRLEKIDMFLLYKIDIGTEIKFKELLKLFERKYESLRKLFIKRQWDLKNQDFKQHGFEFLQNLENQRGLVSIEWKSDKLTQLFVDSFKGSYLVSLKQLKLDFSEKVVDGEAYGKLLGQLFVNINKNNDKFEPINKFNLILDSYVQKREDLGRDVKKYQTRLDVRSKVQKKQQPQNQPQQSNNQPPPPVSQQQSSHQMNQQPISQPVQQLSQQMQQLSISQQPSPQINSQQLPAQQQVPPQSFPQQQSPYQSHPESLRATYELYQRMAQHQNLLQPYNFPQIQPAGQNISHLNFSPMFGSSVSDLDFGSTTYTNQK